jgi:AraC-like DNA-binding protein
VAAQKPSEVKSRQTPPAAKDVGQNAAECCKGSQERCMKRMGATNKNKTTKRWSQKLQIETRWSDTNQRIQLLKQSAEFIDNNHAKAIVAVDIHQHLGLHARKVNEIFLRFYGVSASTYLKEYKCKVLFAQIRLAPKSLQDDHYPSAGMTGSPGEKRTFKTLYGLSVDEHWSRSTAESLSDQAGARPHPTLPSARLEAETIIQKLMATIPEPKAKPQKPCGA